MHVNYFGALNGSRTRSSTMARSRATKNTLSAWRRERESNPCGTFCRREPNHLGHLVTEENGVLETQARRLPPVSNRCRRPGRFIFRSSSEHTDCPFRLLRITFAPYNRKEEREGIEPLGLLTTTPVFRTGCRPFSGALHDSRAKEDSNPLERFWRPPAIPVALTHLLVLL